MVQNGAWDAREFLEDDTRYDLLAALGQNLINMEQFVTAIVRLNLLHKSKDAFESQSFQTTFLFDVDHNLDARVIPFFNSPYGPSYEGEHGTIDLENKEVTPHV